MIVHVELREGRAHHPGIKVATAPGVDLDRRRSGGAYAVGIQAGLLVAFDHRHRPARCAAFEGLDGGAQQRGLARAGAGDEVVGGNPVRREVPAVVRGIAVVRAQQIRFELDGTRRGHGWSLGAARRPGAVVQRTGGRIGRDVWTGFVRMPMFMIKFMLMPVRRAGVGVAAANHTHGLLLQPSCTSSSTTRNSLPPVGRTG